VGALLFSIWAYPFSVRLGTHTFDCGDGFPNAWFLAWDAKALFDPHSSVWNAPVFYPAPGTLAFSDNLFGLLWVSLPVQWLTGRPMFAANVVLVVAFVLCFYTCFLLAHSLTRNIPASLIAGFIFAFHPNRWGHIPHLQLMSFYWAPLALLFVIKFFRTLQRRYIWLAATAICIQYYCSIYLGTMLGVLTVTYVAVYLGLLFGADKFAFSKLTHAAFVHGSLAVLAFTVALMPIALPYLRWAEYWGSIRDLNESCPYSSELLSLLKPLGFAHYGCLDKWLPNVQGGEGAAFLGLVPLILAALGAGTLFRALRSVNDGRSTPMLATTAFFISAMVMGVLMLGPYLIWMGKATRFPLPYQLVYYFVPGGKAMRCPGRFIQPLILCLSMVIAFGVASAWESRRVRNGALRFLGLSALALLFCYDFRVSRNEGIPVETPLNFPLVYDYLRKGPVDRAVFELPAETDYAFRYLLYQTAHWRPEISGRTARYTPAAEALDYQLRGFPSDYGLSLLRISPTMTLVVHLDQYDEATRKKWEQANLEKYGFVQQGRFGDALVWERAGSPPASSLHLRIVNYDLNTSELLLAPAEDSKPWSHPELGVVQVTVRATCADGETRDIKASYRSPPFIRENAMVATELRLPKFTRSAITELELSGRWVVPHSFTQTLLETAATSLNPDAILPANLSMIEGISDGMRLAKSVTIPVRIKVENTGKATWLTQASTTAIHRDIGFVSVGLRWFKRADVQNVRFATGKVAIFEGRIPIPYNMPSSSAATLSDTITIPDQPGEYTVFLEMVSDGVCWFADKHNSTVLRYNVVVE